MAGDKLQDFPDVNTKLAAPTKKSLFERQKAEAEAKRQKEQEETAAVYEDFVKSFDDDVDDDDVDDAFARHLSARADAPGPAFGGAAGSAKRHFSGPGARGGLGRGRGASGPGSLGLPPPLSLSRKRPFEGPPAGRDAKPGLFAYDEDDDTGPTDAQKAFRASDDEDERDAPSRAQERAAPKPTLHLSSLPPGTSPAAVKALVPTHLHVDHVRMLPGAAAGGAERRAVAALVTLAEDTPAGDLDTAVGALQNRYLGWGFRLSISRHLSSAVAGAALPSMPGLSTAALPFGAKPVGPRPGAFSRGGPHRGGFAPPSALTGRGGPAGPSVQVAVAPPADLKQLKLIHKTVEALVAHGPAFEALLMARPEVQRAPHWAWIWDPRSPAGVYYRWRLWDVASHRHRRRAAAAAVEVPENVFAGAPAWAPPPRGLAFEYATAVRELASDADFDSSEEDDSGDEAAAAAARRRLAHLQGPGADDAGPDAARGVAGLDGADDGPGYLNPLKRAKLVHLLARLPPSTARLRRGDVARATAFAIAHAGAGADEVVQLLVANVHAPLCLSSSLAPHDSDASGMDASAPAMAAGETTDDPSSAMLAALYLVSDLLSASSTSGVRHAWRYRALLEATLRERRTFAHLGRLERRLGWGRLRAEKWRRSVTGLLGLWEGWCAFPAAAQEGFVKEFVEPPLTREERVKVEAEEREKGERERAKESGGKWKAVAAKEAAGEEGMGVDGEAMDEDGIEDADGVDDVDGEPMDEDEDVDGVPMEDEDKAADVDGEPMEDVDGGVESAAAVTAKEETKPAESGPDDGAAPPGRRRRPRAEDMFADSDGE